IVLLVLLDSLNYFILGFADFGSVNSTSLCPFCILGTSYIHSKLIILYKTNGNNAHTEVFLLL
ncbi:MAG: hypothetical protein ACK5NI_02675, partial [bacterium]